MRNAALTVVTTIIAVLAVFAAWSPRPSLSANATAEASGFESLVASVRAGVMTSVPTAPLGGTTEQADAACTATKSFIAQRSGIELSERAIEALSASERRFVAAEFTGTSADALVEAMTDWAVDDVLMSVTAADIETSIEAARGFDAPDLPDGFRRGRSRVVIGTGSSTVWSTQEEARAAVAAARADESLRAVLRDRLRGRVDHDVNERIRVFSSADPTRFDRDALSPVEVVLITYSIAAGDYLGGSTAEVRERMRNVQKWIAAQDGHFPSPEGRLPYGTNGYLHSSPADVFIARIDSLLVRTDGSK